MTEQPGTSVEPAHGPPAEPSTQADDVARAVRACPVVVDLADGALATFLPGRRVAGVRLDDDGRCEVSVVLRLDGRPLPELAGQVRDAVRAVVGDREIDVLVADVQAPDDPADASA